MKYNYALLFALLMICGSCRKHIDQLNDFETVVHVTAYAGIYSDVKEKEPLAEVAFMEVFRNILILKHPEKKDCFSFIDLTKGELCRKWGPVGLGPGEFVSFGIQFAVVDSDLVFCCWDTKELCRVSIPDIVSQSDTVSVVKETFPYQVDFRPGYIAVVNDRKIAIGSFKEGRFGVLDSENKIVSTPFDFPFSYPEIQGIYRGSVFQGSLHSNRKQGKFVLSTYTSDIFEIYQVSESGISRVYVTPFNHIPQIQFKGNRYAIDDDKSIVGIMNLSVSDDLICCTYSDRNGDNTRPANRESDEILCFNWAGEKVRKYRLPFAINNFCIDNEYIYGTREHNDETIIYRFKL